MLEILKILLHKSYKSKYHQLEKKFDSNIDLLCCLSGTSLLLPH